MLVIAILGIRGMQNALGLMGEAGLPLSRPLDPASLLLLSVLPAHAAQLARTPCALVGAVLCAPCSAALVCSCPSLVQLPITACAVSFDAEYSEGHLFPNPEPGIRWDRKRMWSTLGSRHKQLEDCIVQATGWTAESIPDK